MAGLKREIKIDHTASDLDINTEQDTTEINAFMKHVLDSEIQALMSVFEQASGSRWASIVQAVCNADTVFVSGYQSIRGVAEDFSRRLSLARDDVRFISAHDSMLGEWIGNSGGLMDGRKEWLEIIDVGPYAREAEVRSKLCRDQGPALGAEAEDVCHGAGG